MLILFVCKQPYLFDFFRALLVGLQSDPSRFVDVVVTFLFFHDYYYDHRWRCSLFCITWEVMFLVVISKVNFDQDQCIYVLLGLVLMIILVTMVSCNFYRS